MNHPIIKSFLIGISLISFALFIMPIVAWAMELFADYIFKPWVSYWLGAA